MKSVSSRDSRSASSLNLETPNLLESPLLLELKDNKTRLSKKKKKKLKILYGVIIVLTDRHFFCSPTGGVSAVGDDVRVVSSVSHFLVTLLVFHWSLHLLLNRTPKKSLLFFLQCLIGSDSQTKRNFQVKSEMAPPRLKNKVICQRSGHSLHPVKQNTAICDVCQEEKDIRITKADGTFGDPNPQLKIHHEKHKAVAGAATSITGVPTSIVETPTSIVETPTSIFIFIVLVAFVLVAVVAFVVVQHSALSD